MNRHSKLAAGVVFLLLVPNLLAIDHGHGFGEPFEFSGKRIVFTTWYWVRQGQTEWRNAAGKSVFADKQEMAGPFDAHFERMLPRGRMFQSFAQLIHLIVEDGGHEGQCQVPTVWRRPAQRTVGQSARLSESVHVVDDLRRWYDGNKKPTHDRLSGAEDCPDAPRQSSWTGAGWLARGQQPPLG